MTEAEKAYQYFVIAVPENEEQAKAYFQARKALRITLTPPNEWVSVEERLPRSQEDVLVVAFWHERWQTMVGWHSDMGRKWRVITPHGEREPGDVTHWMPLPPPPDKDNNVPIKAPNEPLTIEQLREMDGEPVYIHSDIFPEDCGWRVIARADVLRIYFTDRTSLSLTDYGKSWIAYRRPPEGET